MDETLIDRLKTDLKAAEYSASAIEALLGPSADRSRHRGVFAPARRAVAARAVSPLSTLVRLLLLGDSLARAEVDAALPTLGASGACALELLEADDDGSLRAALSLNPVDTVLPGAATPRSWWVLSDLDDQLRRGPARPDHVMGVGGATRSLIAQAPLEAEGVNRDIRTALDLGTGCGIVAMHLAAALGECETAEHDAPVTRPCRVVATDISARALMLARANARLNGLADRIDFRLGNLFEPVVGERFDLILSNPPFVITPRTDDTVIYEYRDGGRAGDELIAEVTRTAPEYLEPGGTLLCLANWETPWGGKGMERVRQWIHAAAERAGTLEAWVIERESVDPGQYAETWARDGGARPGSAEFERLMESWLADFAARKTAAVGLGALRVRRASGASVGLDTIVRTDHASGAFADLGLGPRLAQAFDAGIAAARMSDEQVLDARWEVDGAVVEEREHDPGQESPRSILLRTDRPVARRVAADTLLAAAVGACDGELSLRQIADALATLLEVDPEAAADALVSSARELAWFGMLDTANR